MAAIAVTTKVVPFHLTLRSQSIINGDLFMVDTLQLIWYHYNEWARWRLKTPASQLFTQALIRVRRSKKTSKFRVTGLCAGNSPVTGEFPAQRASNAENISIWWRHHVMVNSLQVICIHLTRMIKYQGSTDSDNRQVTRSIVKRFLSHLFPS